MRRTVDLPHPEGPSSTQTSFSGVVNDTSLIASMSSPRWTRNVLLTPCRLNFNLGCADDVDPVAAIA